MDKLASFPSCSCKPLKYEEYAKIRPVKVYSSIRGEPIMLERMGLFASKVKPDVFTDDEWMTFFSYESELVIHKMRLQSEKMKREISVTHVFIDERGIGTGIISRMKLFGIMDQIGGGCYPEFVGKVFVCNAPFIFYKLYGIIKPLLDVDTASKITIDKGLPIALLQNLMNMEKLPVEYGGKSEEKLAIPLHAQ